MALPLSEMPEELITALLAANFDAASLANRLADAGLRVNAQCPRLFPFAQRAVRTQPRLERSLTASLNRMHAERIQEVRESELELLRTWAVTADWTRCRDFGGVLWALAQDERPEVRAATRVLILRLLQHALRPACRG